MNIKKLVVIACGVLFSFSVALALSSGSITRYAVAAPSSAGNTYVVNSTLDEPDTDPSTGICSSTPSGKCTLRAAIMTANFATGPNTITLPAGVYVLTRPGYDDNALVGDLDIGHNLTIEGAGSGVTIVDGNGAVTGDRVFQVLASATQVTMTGMTIRNGQSLSSTVGAIGGGGLYMEGAGHLLLSDVIIEGNTGQNGGGLYANFSSQGGSMEMDNVIVRTNTVTTTGVGAGGGVFAYVPSSLSRVVIQDSQVYSNTADGTGGGFFVSGNSSAQWSIQRSEIYSNTAASGGAIGNFVPLAMSDSRLHDNHVGYDGGAIEAFSPLVISRTTLDANTAGRFGGGIFDLQTSGSALSQDFAHIENSTLNGNSAQYGGGIYHDGFITHGSLLTLINSTLSGNVVFRPGGATGSADGGGIYVYGGQTQLLNATVASNRVHLQLSFPHPVPGIGGGLYITASATFTAQNSLIANNVRGNGIIPDVPDDCFSSGTVGTLAFNLILTTTNCFVTGPQIGTLVGQDPLLGALQNNGGPTLTQSPLPGSPAIDAGALTGCTDNQGAPLTTDQRGFQRPIGPRCDIGSVEYFDTADLAIAKSVTPSVASPGQHITYTLVLTNNGPVVAQGILITDPMPSELTNLQVIGSGVAITPTGSNPYVWQAGALGVSSRGVITVAGVVDSNVAHAVFTNTVNVTAALTDLDMTNNTSRAAVAVPQAAFASQIYTVAENVAAGVAPIGLSLLPAPSITVTVHYSTTAGTATPGGQYLDVSGQLAFAPGESSQSFLVPIVKDNLPGPNRTVNLILSDPHGALLIAPSTATLVIVDSGGYSDYLPVVIK